MSSIAVTPTARRSHIFEREENDHYAEPSWTSSRLFDVEKFNGPILDPCCGWGRIVDNAITAGYEAFGSDVVDRTSKTKPWKFRRLNALAPQPDEVYRWWRRAPTIVSNPPFDEIEDVAARCLAMATDAVALICPLRRLPAAWPWLEKSPLARVWLMTPRPSMPTGEFILAAEHGERDPKTGKKLKVGGGSQDFCWLVFRHGYVGEPTAGWLHR